MRSANPEAPSRATASRSAMSPDHRSRGANGGGWLSTTWVSNGGRSMPRIYSVVPLRRSQAAESTCQPGKASTAGWQRSATASFLARSMPRLPRPVSILEIVACGIPQAAASSAWVMPCNSRMMRTDSPVVTSTRGRARVGLPICHAPVVQRMNLRSSPLAIQRAADAVAAAVEDVGVDLGGGDVLVAEQFLDGAQVVAVLEQV